MLVQNSRSSSRSFVLGVVLPLGIIALSLSYPRWVGSMDSRQIVMKSLVVRLKAGGGWAVKWWWVW
eukprot:16438619-Heterocapsa_arctica.AAC.1